ncbi:MAG: HD-GYP domain-containing protein [Candidatus Glassbacteria bacterium]
MKYRDLLKRLKELTPDRPSSSRDVAKRGKGVVEEIIDGDGDGRPSVDVTEFEAAVVGEGGKESEIERLFSKMEKFMSFGHGVLSIDDVDEQHAQIASLVKEKMQGRSVREECIPPTDGATKCWDLNQQMGTRSFEDCFQCPAYQGPSAPRRKGEAAMQERAEVAKSEGRAGEFVYESFVSSIKGLYQDAKERKRIDLETATDIATRLLKKVVEDNTLLWQAINARKGSEIASHVLNVAVFSIKVGIGLKYSQDELLLLTTASVLHDLGMTAIPSRIIQKKGKLTRKEYDLIKQHPVHSMEIIGNSVSGKHTPQIERLIRIVGEEHERENGRGYPQGKKSDEIDELAKVIGVLDVFEALSHDREHRSEYSSFQAIQVIIQMRNEFFSTKVVKAVITEISIFPLESYVMLNNGEIGKVVKTNYAHPMRPVVEIVYDSKRKKVKKKKEVDLSSNPLIFITRPVGEEEL